MGGSEKKIQVDDEIMSKDVFREREDRVIIYYTVCSHVEGSARWTLFNNPLLRLTPHTLEPHTDQTMQSSNPVDITHTSTSPPSEESKLSSSPDWLSRPRVPFASVSGISPRLGVSPGLSDVTFKANSPGSNRRNIEKGNYTRTFFQPLLVGDHYERQEALEDIISLLEDTLVDEEAYRSPASLLHVHLGTIVLLSTECPFSEIRGAFQNFLMLLKEQVGFYDG